MSLKTELEYRLCRSWDDTHHLQGVHIAEETGDEVIYNFLAPNFPAPPHSGAQDDEYDTHAGAECDEYLPPLMHFYSGSAAEDEVYREVLADAMTLVEMFHGGPAPASPDRESVSKEPVSRVNA